MKKTIMLARGAILLVFCFLAVNTTFAQNNQWGKWCYKDYTSNGTFTVPEGCTQVWIEAVGGGGAGGFVKGHTALFPATYDGVTCNQMYQVSGGGGGGAYSRTNIYSGLVPNEVFEIKVGVPGLNTADRVTSDEYYDDYQCLDHLDFWPYTCYSWGHVLYKNQGPLEIWPYWDFSWNSLSINEEYMYPFFKNKYSSSNMRDGGDSYVTRNGSTILLAKGGKTCWGINNHTGAAGGRADQGIGDIKKSGGKGGNASDRCNGNLGASSSGGGGGAGNPDNVDNTGGDAECRQLGDNSWNNSFGVGGPSSGIGGAGGNGTSDWAADLESQSAPKQGHPGQSYGGGGGGSKVGTVNWSRGGEGAPGFVRVHFYIEAPALTVDLDADPTSLSGSGTTHLSLNTNAVSQTYTENGNTKNIFQTTYSWNPSVPNNLEPTVNNTTNYCVTVTNICIYANDANTCRVENSDCVQVTVNPVNAGAIAVDNANWVCNPGDTVVTITSTTDASPYPGGTYNWQYSTDHSSWTAVTDVHGNEINAAEYTVPNTTGYYRRGYTYGSNATVYTDYVHVTRPSDINPGTIEDNNHGTSDTVCYGGNVSVTLSANTSYPVTWQTSTNGTDWTPYDGSVTPFEITGLTTKTYIRYLAQYSTSANPCYVPSNNYYTLNVWTNPVVNDIEAPEDICPNLSSYPLKGVVTAGSSNTLTYHWDIDADATVTTNPGRIIPTTTPNCDQNYSYSLYVTDGHNCTSNTVTRNNGFKTDKPTWSYSGAEVTAANPGDHTGNCIFTIPTNTVLKAAVDAAINTTCGNEVTLTYPDEDLEPGDHITETQYIPVTATDMCGESQSITIHVVVPVAPTVEIAPAEGSQQFVCPGQTTTLRATTTAEDPTYQWYPNSLGTNQTATSLPYNDEDVTVHGDYYYVVVTDKYGCTSTGNFTVYTTPKAYIAGKEYTICSDNAATMSLLSDDKVPTGNSAISSLTFNYNTTYTWTISTPNTNITGATEATTAQANFTTGNLFNATLEMQTIVYTVTPTTSTSIDGTVVNSCDGAPFTVTVNVKPKVTNDGAITNFDDADVIITLWYGACDTLYYVHTPSYNNNILPADLEINLTNDKAGTVNQGTTLLGRIAPGEYTIRWTFTDECGNSIFFDKKYIVRYPNCGEDDPNYTEPYRVTYDGYTYTTVRIGCECWLKENLRNQVDADGNNIAVAKVYQNDDSHLNPFGRLYTWYSAMGVTEDDNTAVPTTAQGRLGIYTPGICPEGWAIPKDAQFEDMMTYAHNNTREASSKNQAYWLPGAAGIDPNNGFEAVGAGYYDHYADFYYNLLAETHFWTSTPSSTTYKGKCVTFTHICPEMIKEEMMKGNAISVRCVKIEPKPILD